MNYDTVVDRGVDMLDRHDPTWADEVDTSRLDQGDPRDCVLGQVFGYFGIGVDQLGMMWGDAGEMGFCLPDGVADIFRQVEYGKLTETWIRRIEDKRTDELSEIEEDALQPVLV